MHDGQHLTVSFTEPVSQDTVLQRTLSLPRIGGEAGARQCAASSSALSPFLSPSSVSALLLLLSTLCFRNE